MLLRANEMRAKLRDISVDKMGTSRLLRAFPDMKSPFAAETLVSTRAGVRRLNELAAAARTAAKEVAHRWRDQRRPPWWHAAAAQILAKRNGCQCRAVCGPDRQRGCRLAIQTARKTGISTPQSTKPAKDEPGQ